MKSFLFIALTAFSLSAHAYDCSNVATFNPTGQQAVTVTATALFWSFQGGTYVRDGREIGTSNLTLNTYDIRGREEEAYYCLKSAAVEVANFQLNSSTGPLQIHVVPTVRTRTWSKTAAQDLNFHAYVVPVSDPNNYLDIFARTLSFDLTTQHLILDGASELGAAPNGVGYAIRVEFLTTPPADPAQPTQPPQQTPPQKPNLP